MDRLDNLLRQLADAPVDRPLGQLEPHVWRRIETERRMPLAGWRLPAVSALGALLIGMASTATARVSSAEVSPFSPSLALAPSTLLEQAR